MSDTPFRLAADAPHGLGGRAIDRAKPLQFKLNGRAVDGFAGDTLLSAALASGIHVVGRHGDEAIALDEHFAPLVSTGRGDALPMDRTPAVAGLELTTIGRRRDLIASRGLLGALRNRLVGPGRTLNHHYDDHGAGPPPWLGTPPTETLSADFVVIGGGVAGLSAAATAAAAGRSAILVERLPQLGGNIRFFGTGEGESAPDDTIATLLGLLAGKTPPNVLTSAEAFAISGRSLRVHQVQVENGRPVARVIGIEAGHVVIATGAFERLPLFPGNRLPGTVGALAAFNRAERYGVWAGHRTLFTTPQSYAYRLALHAADAGVDVQRIVDSRVAPTSRFIDFSKAMGITLASALAPSHAEPIKRNEPGLRVSFAVTIQGITQDSTPVETDQLVAAGAWQPDLHLWLRAGGSAAWDDANGWLGPRNRLEHTRLVGSAAGLRTTAAAIASGRAAVLEALGKPAPAVVDEIVEAAFETPDAPTPAAPFRANTPGNAYLDRGTSLVTRRAAAASKHGISGLALRAVQLGLGDIAAAVDIEAMDKAEAGAVASERCAVAGEIGPSTWQLPPAAPAPAGIPEPPAWLAGRFGDKPQLWAVTAADARSFGPGCLIFTAADITNPAQAIGITYGPARTGTHGGIAVMSQAVEGQVFVRDAGTAVASRLTDRLTQ